MTEPQRSETNKSDSGVGLLEGYVTPGELADALKISERTLWRWHRLRVGPPRVVVGRKILYRLESVSAWLAGCEHPEPRAARAKGSRLRLGTA
jgi:hypothetical protein